MKLRIILLALLSTLLSKGLYAQFLIGDIYNATNCKKFDNILTQNGGESCI